MCGLSPGYRVLTKSIASHVVPIFTLVFNAGIQISLNQCQGGTCMIKTTQIPTVLIQNEQKGRDQDVLVSEFVDRAESTY